MNYVTDGTFWVVVLGLAGALWGVWYNLKKKNEETAKDLKELRTLLRDSAKELSEAATQGAQIEDERFCDLLYLIGVIYEVTGILQEHSSKKAKDDLDAYFSNKEEKINSIIKKYEK